MTETEGGITRNLVDGGNASDTIEVEELLMFLWPGGIPGRCIKSRLLLRIARRISRRAKR